jgi:hypothetical protein
MISYFLLLAAAKINFDPQVEQLPDGSYRVEILYRTADVRSNFNSQLKMAKLAEKTCKGRGRPIMPGPINVDQIPNQPHIGKMSEPFTCSKDN